MASDQVWVCEQCNPTLWFTAADVAEKHYADEHQLLARAEEWGELVVVGRTAGGDAAAMLEDWLPAYRKRIEQEFAETLTSLLGLVADSHNATAGTAGTMEEVCDAAAKEQAVREAIASIRVMADLPVDT